MHAFLLLAYYFVSLCQDVLLLFILICYYIIELDPLHAHLKQGKICCFQGCVETFVGAMIKTYRQAVHSLVNPAGSLAVLIVDKWKLFCWQTMVAKSCVNKSPFCWTIRSIRAIACNNEPRIGKNDYKEEEREGGRGGWRPELISYSEVSALNSILCQIGWVLAGKLLECYWKHGFISSSTLLLPTFFTFTSVNLRLFCKTFWGGPKIKAHCKTASCEPITYSWRTSPRRENARCVSSEFACLSKILSRLTDRVAEAEWIIVPLAAAAVYLVTNCPASQSMSLMVSFHSWCHSVGLIRN